MAASLVKWRQWDKEAFDDARVQGKPILLSISAVWCHWCHVMDRTSYSDVENAALINAHFIPVRVDTDRMPDVNERYNMGGWPTTAVLTHSGEVLVGATYMPPDKLLETLKGVSEFYAEHKDALLEKAALLRKKKEDEFALTLKAEPGELGEGITSYVLEELERNYDPLHGGFAWGPKFPICEGLDLLLTAYRDTGRKGFLEMAEKTLEGMSSYGMFDHVMGGFFRYSVTRDWSEPHYEKMLDTNSGLIVNLVNAYGVTGNELYINTVKKTTSYIREWLWDDDGGFFYGSQDADEEYYKLDMSGRMKAEPPYVDRTMFTNLNAKMAVAFLSAWTALGDDELRDMALRSLDFVLANMRGEGGGLFHFHDGRPNRYGLLTDNSAMVRALVTAYQLTGERARLDSALSVLAYMEKTHWDAENGGFFDLPEDKDQVGALANRSKPLTDNSEMAITLKTLHALTGEDRYLEMARECLLPHTLVYEEYSYMASTYALAVDFVITPAVELTIVGRADGPDTAALMKAVTALFVPRRILRVMDTVKDAAEIAKKGYGSSGRAEAYICRESVCTARIGDPDELKEKLMEYAA